MAISAQQLLSTIPAESLCRIIDENASLRSMVSGYVAEEVLRVKLSKNPNVVDISKIPDRDGRKGDFLVKYKLPTPSGVDIVCFSIEVKCLRANGLKIDYLNDSIQGLVLLKTSDASWVDSVTKTFSPKSDSYDVLAVSTLNVDGSDTFYFVHAKYLPRSPRFQDRLASEFSFNPCTHPCVRLDIDDIIKDLD